MELVWSDHVSLSLNTRPMCLWEVTCGRALLYIFIVTGGEGAREDLMAMTADFSVLTVSSQVLNQEESSSAAACKRCWRFFGCLLMTKADVSSAKRLTSADCTAEVTSLM